MFFSSGLAQTPQTYTVVSGDTLTGIAARFDTTVKDLQTLNALAGANIRAGQVLRVGAREDALPKGFERYTVAAGDTLSGIASRFKVSEAALRAVNPALLRRAHPAGGDAADSPRRRGGRGVGAGGYRPGLGALARPFALGAHASERPP